MTTHMRRLRPYILVCFSTVAVFACAVPMVAARAEMGMAATKPLVVIRFNQPHVYYDQQLYGAVSQAVAQKPDVTFDIVSNAPVTGNTETDAKWVTLASHNTQAVVAALQRMGVPAERLRVTGQTQPELRYDETHVYVR